MITIIPALINNEKVEYLLNETIFKVPYNSSLILITQQKRPHIRYLDHIQLIEWIHFDRSIGKWNAIKEGQKILRKCKLNNDRIILLDADDPIKNDSLVAAYKLGALMEEDWLIGCRKEILLYADDQFSNRSRFYLEAFSNSLLLLQLISEDRLLQMHAPDIQSGFYIFKLNIFKNIELFNSLTYGGELMIFHQLMVKGCEFRNFNIEITEIRPSHYNISQIINNIVQLQFFKNLNCELIKRAIQLTPVLYKRYFYGADYSSFQEEVRLMLKSMGYENCIK